MKDRWRTTHGEEKQQPTNRTRTSDLQIYSQPGSQLNQGHCHQSFSTLDIQSCISTVCECLRHGTLKQSQVCVRVRVWLCVYTVTSHDIHGD